MARMSNPRLRTYIRLDSYGNPIPGSVVRRFRAPKGGGNRWVDLTETLLGCCAPPTTSTTTSTTTTTP